MPCHEPSQTSSCSGGCGCSASGGTPWLAALLDAGLRGRMLRRFGPALAAGALAGLALGAAALLLSEPLGPLGPALGGPWLRLRAAATLPAGAAAGVAVALRAGKPHAATLVLAGIGLALGGALNAGLESGGTLAAVAAFLLLGLPLAAAGSLLCARLGSRATVAPAGTAPTSPS